MYGQCKGWIFNDTWKYKIFLLSFNYTSIVLKYVILQINFIPLDVNSGGYY